MKCKVALFRVFVWLVTFVIIAASLALTFAILFLLLYCCDNQVVTEGAFYVART